MTSKIITISGKGMDIVERLLDGMESRGLIELFGLKFSGVTLETGVHAAEPFALMTAQEVAAVQPAPWSGDGLPPVGTVCECQDNNLRWKRGVIVHAGTDRGLSVAVMQCADEILWGESGEFRPIKTPAQIAAEEREAAAKAMRAIVTRTHPAECPYLTLYDAGLRFPKGDDK